MAHRPYVDNQDGTITDPATGLVWERADGESNVNHAAADSYCSGTGGAPGTWRMPTYLELLSLIDYGADSMLASGASPVTDSPGLWSQNMGAGGGAVEWHYYVTLRDFQQDLVAHFFGGEFTWGGAGLGPGVLRSVRCVRGNLEPESPAVVLGCDDSGVVRDPRTGLEWQHEPATVTHLWEGALSYCRELCENGGGWRLASIKELGTLFRADTERGAIEPFWVGEPATFWTSTPSIKRPSEVFIVNFVPKTIGILDPAYDFPIRTAHYGEPHRAWCVRSYQP